jgi:hypothetical protein
MMETLAIALVTALVNGFVTWGILKTELRYLRRDVDHALRRLDKIGAPHVWAAEDEAPR